MNQLRVLGLSRLEFDIHALASLEQIVLFGSSLENLDLSYGHFFKAHALAELLRAFEKAGNSNSIQQLNLSFNPVIKELERVPFAQALCSFIGSSMSLTHLNISACGLSDNKLVMQIFQGVRKSKTLQSVHFSGNHLDPRVTLKSVRELLGIAKVEKSHHSLNGIFT
jgi:hypothetical protein